jgi:hypothetical protein
MLEIPLGVVAKTKVSGFLQGVFLCLVDYRGTQGLCPNCNIGIME